MRLIGLHGRKRSGKDTAYQIIKDEYDGLLNVERVGFADKLKLSACRALGFDGTLEECLALCDRLKEDGGKIFTYYDNDQAIPEGFDITGREFLQRYGTEAHRDVFGDSFWIDAVLPDTGLTESALMTAMQARYPDVDVLCVTDVRFQNEAQRILDLGGEIWWIDASYRLGGNQDLHPSERPLDPQFITDHIPNNGTVEEFEQKVRRYA